MREKRRLRMAVLAAVTLVLIGAVPMFFAVRAMSHDPVFDSLDALDVPAWAAVKPVDNVSGSRWCFLACRLRERTVQSERPPQETAPVYERALAEAGWTRWKVAHCPETPTKGYTCWRQDELTLDLWVREPTCAVAPAVPPSEQAKPGNPAPEECTGSTVSLKVRNAIDDERTRPLPADPKPTPVR